MDRHSLQLERMHIFPGGYAVLIPEGSVKSSVIAEAADAENLVGTFALGKKLAGDEQSLFLDISVDAGAYQTIEFVA